MWGEKAYARLGRLAGLSEPILVTYAVSTIMSWAGEDTFLYLALIFALIFVNFNSIDASVKVFRIIPEFRILRLTFHRKSASKC